MVFIRGTGKFVGRLLYCNGGESLSHKRCFHSLPSAAFKESFDLLSLPGKHNDLASYASVLKSFGSSKALQEGKCTHHLIISHGLDLDTFMVSHLVQMYGTCAAFDDAFSLFAKMAERSVFSWNFIIRSCARHGENEKVLILLEQMQCEGAIPTKVTFVSIFDACTGLATLDAGHRMHALIFNSPFAADIVVGTALVNMYGNFGNIEGAWLCFDKMLGRDVIAWTALISAISQYAQGREVLYPFEQMLQEATLPNEVTFISLCDACANHVMISDGKRMHALVSCVELEAKFVVENALINMYVKCGSLKPAEAIFKLMNDRTLVSWTAIISAYSQNGCYQAAVQHFFHMLQLGILPDNVLFTTILSACESSVLLAICKHMHAMIVIREPEMDVIIGTALVNTYGKCQDVVSAKSTFDSMADRNVYSWNAAIVAFTQNGHDQEAARIFYQMQEEGVLPDNVTFVSILDAFASEAAFEQGKQVHATIISVGLDSRVFVASALIDMYAKCGNLHCAHGVLNRLSTRDVGSWSALITAYAQHGHGKKTLELAAQMSREGIRLNHITLLSILSACSHAGLVNEGCFFFDTLSREHAIKLSAKHYACIVDLLGRAGRLEEAHKLIQKMQVKPTASLWMSLLSACRLYGNVELATHAAEKVHQLEPQSAAPFQLLFDMHVSSAAGLAKAEQILQPGDASKKVESFMNRCTTANRLLLDEEGKSASFT